MYNSSTRESLINGLVQLEHNPGTAGKFPIFKRDSYKGEKPALILVLADNKTKAKTWCRTLAKLTKAHVKAVDSPVSSFEMEAYMEENKIPYLFLLEFSPAANGIIISAQNETVQSFLTQSFTVGYPFVFEPAGFEPYPKALTTHITMGPDADLEKLMGFVCSYVDLLPKLSLEDNESHILKKSEAKVKENIPYNRVELHPTFLQQYHLQENDYVVIYNPLNFKYTVACVKSTANMALDEIITSLSIQNKLELWTNIEIVLHPLKKIVSQKVTIQNVNKLADGHITVADDLFQMITQYGADYFEVVNRTTSASFDIEACFIQSDASLGDGTVKLSYLQRELLGFENPPDTLSPFYFNRYHDELALNDEQRQFINSHYANKKVHEIKTYEGKTKAKKIFTAAGYYQPAIYPIYQKHKKSRLFFLKKVFVSLLNWLIRPSSLKLKVIRPYSTDESSNIVRISKSVMSLLGIEENDRIRILYRGKSIEVPVLELDSPELIKETNIVTNESSMNLSIGIPAHLRYKLGIKQIGKTCDVERDMYFLFKKNWNLQFLPILATIIAILTLDPLGGWLKLILSIIIVPFSSYITLSSVREKIPKL
ncbi:hypothetical protein [Neobacillus sp. Marseille-QA0830]